MNSLKEIYINCNKLLALIIFFVVLSINFSVYSQNQDFELAKQYMNEEKYEEATVLLETLTDKNFKDEYYKLLLSAYAELGERKKQEKLIKKAVKKSNDNFKYVIDLGTFYINNNEKAKGEKQYDLVLKNLTANNSEIVKTANYFASVRNYEYSIKTYQTARKLFKDNTKYTYELTYYYQLLGRNIEIAKEYLLLLNANPNTLPQIEVNINNLFNRDKDDKLYNVFSEVILDEIKSKPDNRQINHLYYWLQIQKGDYASAFIQAKAINKRFKDDDFQTLLDFAQSCQNVKQYKYSIDAYDYILKQKPEQEKQNNIKQKRLNCLYLQFVDKVHHLDKEIFELKREYDGLLSELGYTPSSAPIMEQYAYLLAYHIGQPQQAVDLLDSIINMRQVDTKTKAQCKLSRADIYLINGDVWEASLTYSQVDKDMKNETLGSEAKFRNAMLSYYIGDFEWAESQFDALRSSTTKLIANDAMEYSLLIKENIDEDSTYKGLAWFSKADFALYQNKIEEAKKYLDSIENWYLSHPLFDEVLYKRAQIAIKEGDFSGAEQYLEDIITNYPYDLMADDAIMLAAQLNEVQFRNKEKAKQFYEKLILDYPSSLYIQQARKKYNEK